MSLQGKADELRVVPAHFPFSLALLGAPLMFPLLRKAALYVCECASASTSV